MSKLIFFHQKRRDGAVRTGIESNDISLLEAFEQNDAVEDSALLWFVDVRCEGEDLPETPEEAREWFLNRSEAIQKALYDLSVDLAVGIDSEWPAKKIVPSMEGYKMAVFCTAIRRIAGLEISEVLRHLAKNWHEIIRDLQPSRPVEANG